MPSSVFVKIMWMADQEGWYVPTGPTSLSGYSTSPKLLTTKRGIDLALVFLPFDLLTTPTLAIPLKSTSLSSPVSLLPEVPDIKSSRIC